MSNIFPYIIKQPNVVQGSGDIYDHCMCYGTCAISIKVVDGSLMAFSSKKGGMLIFDPSANISVLSHIIDTSVFDKEKKYGFSFTIDGHVEIVEESEINSIKRL